MRRFSDQPDEEGNKQNLRGFITILFFKKEIKIFATKFSYTNSSTVMGGTKI